MTTEEARKTTERKVTKDAVYTKIREVRAALRQAELLTVQSRNYDDFWFAASAAGRARRLSDELGVLLCQRQEDERQRIVAETGVDP